MTKENDATEIALINIDNTSAVDLFQPKIIDQLIGVVKQKIAARTPSVETAKDRAEIKTMSARVARSKTLVDGIGKELVSDWKTQAKKVDIERKRFRDEMDDLKIQVRQPLTDWEEAEHLRKSEIGTKMNNMQVHADFVKDNWSTAEMANLSEARKRIEEVLISTDIFMEFTERASDLKEKCRGTADQYLQMRIELNAERDKTRLMEEENARLKADAEKVAQDKRDAEIAAAAKEKAEAKAKADAEAKETADAAAMEAKENKAIAEQKLKDDNARHVKKIHKHVVLDLMNAASISDSTAQFVLQAIKAGKIRNVRLTY